MRRTCGLVLVGLLTAALPAAAISLCDYQTPETSLTEMGLALNFRYFDDGATPEVDVNSGKVELDYSQLYDSPSSGFSLSGLGRLSLADYVPTDLLAHGSGSLRFYLDGTSAFYAFGGAEGSVSLSVASLDVRAGGGYGRFTDVTPMAKAMRIRDKLVSTGALDAPISDIAVVRIAETIGRRIEFETLRDLVHEIEDAVESETGAELDARSLLWIEEIVDRDGDQRRCGWTVQGGLGYELIDPEGGNRDLLATLTADAAWTLMAVDQMILHAGFSAPLAAHATSTLNVSGSYKRSLSDMAKLDLRFMMQRIVPSDEPASSTWSVSATIAYPLRMGDIGLQASFGQKAGDPRMTTEVGISASLDLL